MKGLVLKARRLYRRWSGADATRAFSAPTPDLRTVTVLGEVTELSYLSDKEDGKTREYVHAFKPKMLLAATVDRKTLLVFSVPGKVQVTDRGIVS